MSVVACAPCSRLLTQNCDDAGGRSLQGPTEVTLRPPNSTECFRSLTTWSASEGLKPERVGEPTQEFVPAVVMHDGLRNDPAQKRHSRGQPGWYAACMQWKIRTSRTAHDFHADILPDKKRRAGVQPAAQERLLGG